MRGDPAGRTVYLTFDDGPVPGSTERVLALLARWDALATFFPIGEQIAMYPELARAEAAAGHAIGSHTWHHENLASAGAGALDATVGASLRALRRATHRTTSCLRPPFGAIAGSTASRAAALGLRLVLWDVDPQDWRLPGSGAIAARVLAGVRPGSIVLLHDGGGPRGGTIAALGTILRVLTARGYRFAALPCG
ncbi:MAG: polysaccharide deacetylase family protein [Thermoleophilia bacterium]